MVLLYKTKVWWKCKTLFYGYRQIHCSFKKQKILIKILQEMLKQDLTLQFLNQTYHFLKKKKSNWNNIRWIRWTYHGRHKRHKKCVIKRKIKFQDYKNCLEATQIENKTNHLAQNKTDVDSLKEDQKNS